MKYAQSVLDLLRHCSDLCGIAEASRRYKGWLLMLWMMDCPQRLSVLLILTLKVVLSALMYKKILLEFPPR